MKPAQTILALFIVCILSSCQGEPSHNESGNMPSSETEQNSFESSTQVEYRETNKLKDPLYRQFYEDSVHCVGKFIDKIFKENYHSNDPSGRIAHYKGAEYWLNSIGNFSGSFEFMPYIWFFENMNVLSPKIKPMNRLSFFIALLFYFNTSLAQNQEAVL